MLCRKFSKHTQRGYRCPIAPRSSQDVARSAGGTKTADKKDPQSDNRLSQEDINALVRRVLMEINPGRPFMKTLPARCDTRRILRAHWVKGRLYPLGLGDINRHLCLELRYGSRPASGHRGRLQQAEAGSPRLTTVSTACTQESSSTSDPHLPISKIPQNSPVPVKIGSRRSCSASPEVLIDTCQPYINHSCNLHEIKILVYCVCSMREITLSSAAYWRTSTSALRGRWIKKYLGTGQFSLICQSKWHDMESESAISGSGGLIAKQLGLQTNSPNKPLEQYANERSLLWPC